MFENFFRNRVFPVKSEEDASIYWHFCCPDCELCTEITLAQAEGFEVIECRHCHYRAKFMPEVRVPAWEQQR